VGIGEFLGLRSSGGPGGESLFNVRYLSPMLSAPVGIQELRKDPTFRDALFLKAGPAGTVFPLTVEQGERIYGLVAWQNPFVLGVWPDVREVSRGADVLPDLDILGTSGTEGRRRLVSHLRLERDRGVVEAKKRTVLKANGNLACEVCMFDFVKHYGRLGEGFCEVHHRKMLSKTVGERVTNLKDLAVVCSNCHRMLHRGATLISIEKLRLTLNSA
jgi:hypothetical protein